ncbi:MAG: phosphoglucosamine mutase [Acidobacteria bacterium]|nr:MAG: phosphoglucosamine mutase [Acidobacteriota bacterium]PYY24455.1 MAG: phosphoglucosamine mutase [Acidobacteriota bacterium]
MQPIKFGTDGWRGIIADDYTFANVRRAASAITNYVLKNEDSRRGVVVGYDTRFGSAMFAQAVAEVLATAGIDVQLSNDYTPTPALSFGVKYFGAAGGVMITSSHNPFNWNGVKYKASYGGSGRPAIMQAIEAELDKPVPKGSKAGTISDTDFKQPYIEAIKKFADLEKITAAGFKFLIDSMYGSGRCVLSGIFAERGIKHVEIRSEVNPLFPGINPEPIEPHVREAQEAVVRERCHGGLITDGDADRIGAVAEDGSFVDSHKIYSILLRWLLERKKWPGEVVRAFNTTKMVDRIAAEHGRRLHECGIGFKNICDLMLERDILIGGEESGGIGITRHLPERDGILNALLLANVMAEEKRTLAELVQDLQKKYGEHYYARLDMHIPNELKESAITRAKSGVREMGGNEILRVETLDGVKFFLDAPKGKPGTASAAAEAWLLLRASGTEPLLRVYSEAGSPEIVQQLLKSAEAFVYQGEMAGTAAH